MEPDKEHELVRRLRGYRPPSADPYQPREHHPICDEAATTIESLLSRIEEVERERDEALRDLDEADEAYRSALKGETP